MIIEFVLKHSMPANSKLQSVLTDHQTLIIILVIMTKFLHVNLYQRQNYSRGGGEAHNLWIEEGLSPGFQKGTLFLLPKLAFGPISMMNFDGKLPILTILGKLQTMSPMLEAFSWKQLNLSIINLDSKTLHLKSVHQKVEIQASKVKVYSALETRGFVKGASYDLT